MIFACGPQRKLPPIRRRFVAGGVLLALTAIPTPALGHDWNGLALDPSGNLFTVDGETGRIFKVTPEGKVSEWISAKVGETLLHPHHLAFDSNGALYLPSG